jgi:large subunit ribosomal protein L13
MLFDAKDLIVGRLGTVVAKKALLGEKIDIINAEQAVVTGKKSVVLGRFKERMQRGTWAKGPHFIRSSDRLLKRMIRNMLPYKQPKGEAAFKRIKCWVGTPDEFKDKKAEIVPGADVSKLPNLNYVPLSRVSKELCGKIGGNVD